MLAAASNGATQLLSLLRLRTARLPACADVSTAAEHLQAAAVCLSAPAACVKAAAGWLPRAAAGLTAAGRFSSVPGWQLTVGAQAAAAHQLLRLQGRAG